jgi:3-hydroxy-9,10-secoandrosta-1,3,5(10)-triene-9,17-dione monooxygenase
VVQNILELCWQAMDLMFRTSGASVARRGSLLGRAYKNLAVIRTHITLQGHVTALNVGRLHFGLAPSSLL